MEKDIRRLHQRKGEGQCCSQILVGLGLDLLGAKNEGLERAASGLCGGLRSGLTCGCLTGGAMLLSLFDEKQAEEMIPELVQWFRDRCGETYGGVDCRSILEGHPENQALRCPKLMEATYREARELLEEFGFDIDGMAEEAFPD